MEFCFYNGDIEELCNYENDPVALNNLAAHPQQQEHKETMKKKLYGKEFVGYNIHCRDVVGQLFSGRQMMVEARWPNMSIDQIYDRTSWAKSAPGSRFGELVDPELSKTNIDWTGAIPALNVAHQFYTWTHKVSQKGVGADRITYAKDFNVTKYAETSEGWDDGYYYLFGKREALDAPTEWFYDRRAKVLYFYPRRVKIVNRTATSFQIMGYEIIKNGISADFRR